MKDFLVILIKSLNSVEIFNSWNTFLFFFPLFSSLSFSRIIRCLTGTFSRSCSDILTSKSLNLLRSVIFDYFHQQNYAVYPLAEQSYGSDVDIYPFSHKCSANIGLQVHKCTSLTSRSDIAEVHNCSVLAAEKSTFVQLLQWYFTTSH